MNDFAPRATVAGRWTRLRIVAALGALVALALGVLSFGLQAYATFHSAGSDPVDGDLRVTAAPQPTEFFDLAPGDRRYWSIHATLDDAERGTFSLRLFGAGELIEHPRHGLTIAVEACDGVLTGSDPAVRPACSGDVETIVADQALAPLSVDGDLAGGEVWDLPDILQGTDRSFLVTIGIPAAGSDDRTLQGLRGNIGVGLYAAGDHDETPVPSPPPDAGSLPDAGGPALALALIALGAVGLGLILTHGRRGGEPR